MRERIASWLAWSLCALTLVLVACVLVFTVLQGAHRQGLTFLIGVVSCALVGGVVASRRPHNPVGWFFAVSAACFAVGEATFRYAVYGILIDPGSLPAARAMAWPQTWLWAPGVALVIIFLPLYFPNGRLLSPRWRPVLWLAIALSFSFAFFSAFMPGEVSDVSGVANPLGMEALRPVLRVVEVVMVWMFPVVVFFSAASLIVRFWRSRGEERQQMKWLTYAVATMAVMILLTNWLDAMNSVLFAVVDTLTALVFAGIPVAAGIAVLKYRLYEVDTIINRTLVYGSLTAMLALVYLGGVVSLQYVFRAFTGGGSQLAIVASTLAIAALFNPLRRRVQAFVDRRFYRRKYDARKTLEAFSTKLRDETDLDALSQEFLSVVRETLQPEHVSLWLRPSGRIGGEER
ncbi:MAG: hypothetical protein M3N09_09395 [Actinomycetota bacterium]|nr:hypothetical protein [Actinomycetota bacterium]